MVWKARRIALLVVAFAVLNLNLFVNAEGQLIVGMGTDVSIDPEGQITLAMPDSAARRALRRISLYTFTAPASLSLLGGSLYQRTAASGEAIESGAGQNGTGLILRGHLETSNVEIFRERLRLQFLSSWRESIIRSLGVSKR